MRPRGRSVAYLLTRDRMAATQVGNGSGGVAEAERLRREQPASHGLPDGPAQRLGYWPWSDRGGRQDHRRTIERVGHALGGGGRSHGSGTACPVRERRQTRRWLLGPTASSRRLKSPK